MWNIPQSIKTFGSVWDFIWLLYFYFTSCWNILLLFVSNGWENKRSSGLCKRSCWICILFFFRLDYFFTCMNMLLSCLSGKPMLPTCLSLSGLCWIGFTFVRNRFESNSNSWMTSSIVYNIFATRRTGRKKLFLEITTYLMAPTAVHGQK